LIPKVFCYPYITEKKKETDIYWAANVYRYWFKLQIHFKPDNKPSNISFCIWARAWNGHLANTWLVVMWTQTDLALTLCSFPPYPMLCVCKFPIIFKYTSSISVLYRILERIPIPIPLEKQKLRLTIRKLNL
jgi:hypothetical protein